MRFFLIVVLTASLCACDSRRAAQQQAIKNVLDAANAAQTNSTHIGRRAVPVFKQRQLYVEGLHQISTTNCPEKFRLAFLDYVQTCERASKAGAGIGSTAEYASGALSKNSSAMVDANKHLDAVNVDEAHRRLEMAALDYGVGR